VMTSRAFDRLALASRAPADPPEDALFPPSRAPAGTTGGQRQHRQHGRCCSEPEPMSTLHRALLVRCPGQQTGCDSTYKHSLTQVIGDSFPCSPAWHALDVATLGLDGSQDALARRLLRATTTADGRAQSMPAALSSVSRGDPARLTRPKARGASAHGLASPRSRLDCTAENGEPTASNALLQGDVELDVTPGEPPGAVRLSYELVVVAASGEHLDLAIQDGAKSDVGTGLRALTVL
jgi:hypothetical protein